MAAARLPILLAPVIAAMATAAAAPYLPCVSAITPRVVDDADLPGANAARSAVAGALMVEILTETILQRVLDEDTFGAAYGLALPASIGGIVVGSLIAPVLAETLGGPGALVAVGCAVLAYALVVLRGTVKVPGAIRASLPAVADAVPAR